jgi:hypothetical protein
VDRAAEFVRKDQVVIRVGITGEVPFEWLCVAMVTESIDGLGIERDSAPAARRLGRAERDRSLSFAERERLNQEYQLERFTFLPEGGHLTEREIEKIARLGREAKERIGTGREHLAHQSPDYGGDKPASGPRRCSLGGVEIMTPPPQELPDGRLALPVAPGDQDRLHLHLHRADREHPGCELLRRATERPPVRGPLRRL